MKEVLIAEGKGDDYILEASTKEELYASALWLLKHRSDLGYWYDDWEGERLWATEAKNIVAKEDGVQAWRFLKDRSDDDFEYETVRLRSVGVR